MRKRLFVVLVLAIALSASPTLFARDTGNISIGAQLGFLATGVVVDVDLGPVAVNAGVNYPLGWTYISILGGLDSASFPAMFTVTADVTFPMALSDDFTLKFGASTLGFTDFESGIIGVLGGTVKGEYWIPDRDYGLFVNLNVPVMLYGSVGELFGDESVVFFSPWLPLAGLLTTTAGMLWSF